MERSALYDAWACLLVYPDEQGIDYARSGLGRLLAEHADGSDQLDLLGVLLAEPDAGAREETFTRTFDGSDRCALEIGWHLHGENYARGALLVRLRKLLKEHGLLTGAELPDHLGVVLGLLGRAKPDLADALVRGIVLPALEKLSAGFEKDTGPYGGVIEGVRRFLSVRHALAQGEQAPLTGTQGAQA
jgi:nitrate reductase assembly molybdenum cofactor insertion protein NarJ